MRDETGRETKNAEHEEKKAPFVSWRQAETQQNKVNLHF